MKIDKMINENELTMKLEGRLDTITAPELEKEIGDLTGISTLIFDFEKLEYISSAGLRILLSCQKKMNTQGTMIIQNVNQLIKEIFDMTGFSEIITIE